METRKYIAAGNWAAMDTDILCLIFTRLPYVDLLCVHSTCWGWNAAVDLFKSSSASSSFQEMPWLVFTPLEQDEVETCTQGEKTGRFVNMEEKRVYPFNDSAIQKMNDGGCYCIGSSHDWLVCLDKQAIPYLLNPFTAHRIDLPRLDLSLGVEKVDGTCSNCDIKINKSAPIGRNIFVGKAVLSSSPSLGRNYCLVITYGCLDKHLGFCKHGDTSWSKLDCNDGDWYEDIMVHENQLYGLYMHPGFSSYLKVWVMNQDGFLLVKKIGIVLEDLMTASTSPVNHLYDSKLYLVENQGNLLVVNRFIATSLASFDSFEAQRNDRTSKFYVYKLEADQKSFSVVTSLCGFSLFLGKNQAMSVDASNCKMFKQDCIYFTDDAQGSAHDSGVFSLKDYSVHWLFGNKIENRNSGATWVVPLVKLLN